MVYLFFLIGKQAGIKISTFTMEYYSAIKNNEIMPLAATWMDLEIIILSEVNQTNMILLIWGILKKNDTNELIYKTETDSLT